MWFKRRKVVEARLSALEEKVSHLESEVIAYKTALELFSSVLLNKNNKKVDPCDNGPCEPVKNWTAPVPPPCAKCRRVFFK